MRRILPILAWLSLLGAARPARVTSTSPPPRPSLDEWIEEVGSRCDALAGDARVDCLAR
ncbi:MAG: hypothetical protein H6736_11310 [Alphaproteobacteria bacterium]|nr:hypothetical protein [Alphaproteobacteria bacterium]